jgi:hypothetical protein
VFCSLTVSVAVKLISPTNIIMSIFEDFLADLTPPVEANEFGDLPQLDFDTSTLTSSGLSLDPAASVPPYLETLSMDFTVDSLMHDHQVPMRAKPETDSEEMKR